MPRERARAVPRAPRRSVKSTVIAAVDPQLARAMREAPKRAPQARRKKRVSDFAIVSPTFVD